MVSRNDIYGESDHNEATVSPQSPTNPFFDFVEVDVADSPTQAHDTADQLGDEAAGDTALMEFQLFGGSQPIAVDLAEPKQVEYTGRPLEYYIFKTTPAQREHYEESAIPGDLVLKEARFWQHLASQNPIAPDINRDFAPTRRKCRPGKQARANKRLKNERLAQERKEANERFKNRRKGGFQFRKRPK